VQVCQQNADSAFVIALAIPSIVAIFTIAWLLRPPPNDSNGSFFTDPDTGTVFQTVEGVTPERDRLVRLNVSN
jgi:hypothetical protein